MNQTPAWTAVPDAAPGRGAIRQYFDRGVHPATLRPLARDFQCGDCVFLTFRQSKKGPPRLKCSRKAAHRGGPDIKRNFPACDVYQAAPDSTAGADQR